MERKTIHPRDCECAECHLAEQERLTNILQHRIDDEDEDVTGEIEIASRGLDRRHEDSGPPPGTPERRKR